MKWIALALVVVAVGCRRGVSDPALVGPWACEGEYGSGLFLDDDGEGFVFIEGERTPLTWNYDGQNFDVTFTVDGAETPQSYSTSYDSVKHVLPLGRKMPGVGCSVLVPGELQLVPRR